MTQNANIQFRSRLSAHGRLAVVGLCLAGSMLSACTALSPRTPEEIVHERAQARWEALIAGEWEKAYSFSAPSYRALVDFKRYRGRIGGAVSWTGVEVVKVACEAEACTATIRIDYKMAPISRDGVSSTHVDETWILEDGAWWWHQRL